MTLDPKIYGHGTTEHIVNVSAKRGQLHIYRETPKGVTLEVTPYTPWVLAECALDDDFEQLDGDNAYKYIRFFQSEKSWREFKRNHKNDIWSPRTIVDEYLLTSGETYHKGTMRKDVSVLSWDIETAGLHMNESAKVYLIANTYRKGDTVIRKLFDLNDYRSQRDMFDDWCKWVRQMNPSIMLGHNLICYDIPYLLFCADKCGASIQIGRDGSVMELAMFESQFRVDASRSMKYRMPSCHGREIVDTLFLMINFDLAKKYTSYALKKLIKEAGLEQADRVFVDAGKIWQMWDRRHAEPDTWKAVCAYAERDGDDAIALWDLAGDSVFYPSQALPMTFTRVCMSASGGQINGQLIRAYLADGHSIPKATEKRAYQGALSYGFPGTYRNCVAFDVNSLYPSIIIQYDVYDRAKDPKGYVLYMVKFYRQQRLELKALASSGDPYYTALDSTAKRSLNSFYGFYGSQASNFNSPECAELITRKGREILGTAIKWATGKTYEELLSE